MIEIIEDSIFNSKEKYLCHQCNCVTQRATHLSKDVFTRENVQLLGMIFFALNVPFFHSRRYGNCRGIY